jgi:proteic killer suppression protein
MGCAFATRSQIAATFRLSVHEGESLVMNGIDLSPGGGYSGGVIMLVEVSTEAQKQLRRAPPQVQSKLASWVRRVREAGLETVVNISGYHDEPLKWERAGQRSIRLNQQWRAVYVTSGDRTMVVVIEVTPHKY